MVKIAENLSLNPKFQKKFNRTTKKSLKNNKLRKTNKSDIKKSGLVYLGHVPHGFYEPEMKEFFSQFGQVTASKLCRSSKTGRSKGYAFVEFRQPEVAKIAAETMNNYLMFKKRLIAKYVPPEQRPKFLFNSRRTVKQTRTLPTELRQKRQVLSKNTLIRNDPDLKKLTEKLTNKLKKKQEMLKKRQVEICIKTVLRKDRSKSDSG